MLQKQRLYHSGIFYGVDRGSVFSLSLVNGGCTVQLWVLAGDSQIMTLKHNVCADHLSSYCLSDWRPFESILCLQSDKNSVLGAKFSSREVDRRLCVAKGFEIKLRVHEWCLGSGAYVASV